MVVFVIGILGGVSPFVVVFVESLSSSPFSCIALPLRRLNCNYTLQNG